MSDSLSTPSGWRRIFFGSRLVQVLRYRDFRLLWTGAFLSFTGSWVERVAQGYFVYNLTHMARSLAFVSFANSAPVLFFGLFAGSFSDHFDKKIVLIWTQVIFALTAGYLAVATYFGFVQYWHILVVALINGLVSCVEMPTRQSIVSRVVPLEDLAAAVPVNAMTFNVARIFGPALGGLVLAQMGVAACYMTNSLSFFALVWVALAIKSNLKPRDIQHGTLSDLVFEGARYTFRDVRLRTLFFLEGITACFGLAYIPLIPAYVQDFLKFPNPKAGNGYAYSAIGLGALIGLIVVTQIADTPRKGAMIRFSMWTISFGLFGLAVFRSYFLVFPILGMVGLAAIMQLNTTNALFQLLSPDRLRGRVLAMHIWALNGLSPFGVLPLGWIADNGGGVPLAFKVGSGCMFVGAIAATLSRRGLANLIPASADDSRVGRFVAEGG
jgi:MFS family permease